MEPSVPIPEDLRQRGFTRADAAAAGLSHGRLRRQDVQRPFHGVQSLWIPESVESRARVYSAKLKPGQFFSHSTAARLLGLTLPSAYDAETVTHVSAVRPADAPHSREVRGHRLVIASEPVEVNGLPVADALEVFCQLGAELTFEDLVVLADELLNRSTGDVDDARRQMLERIALGRRLGGAKLARAVHAARRGARSPAETRVRLVLQAAGLPPAELNAPIHERVTGRYLGSPDPVWRQQRVVLEYEGDQHRTDRGQWRYDVLRYDDLAADGWRVIRATGDDLTVDGRRRLAQRVRRALTQP